MSYADTPKAVMIYDASLVALIETWWTVDLRTSPKTARFDFSNKNSQMRDKYWRYNNVSNSICFWFVKERNHVYLFWHYLHTGLINIEIYTVHEL